MGSPAAGLAAGLAADLFGPGFAALGAGLAAGLAGGSNPCGRFSGSGTPCMKYNFPLSTTFANPHTPRALFAHTISVSDAVSSSTLPGKPLSTEVN